MYKCNWNIKTRKYIHGLDNYDKTKNEYMYMQTNSDNLSRYIQLVAALHVVLIQIQMGFRAQGRICIFIYPLI